MNGFDHIPCHIGTMVCYGNQDTVNLQFRIDFPANFTDGANDTGKTFDIKNQRLYGNQNSVCGCKRGGDKVAEFRHTVNQTIVVLPLKWFQRPLHYAFTHKGICQTSLQIRKLNVGGNDIYFFIGMDNNIGRVYLVAGSLNQLFQGRTFVPLRTAKVSAQAGLRVGVHQQNFITHICQCYAQVYSGRSFAHTAFLVGNRYCFHTRSPRCFSIFDLYQIRLSL